MSGIPAKPPALVPESFIPAYAANWPSLKAEGEYFDFSSWDFEASASRLAGQGFSLHRPQKVPQGAEVSLLSELGSHFFPKFFSSLKSSHPDKALAFHSLHVQDGFFVDVEPGAEAKIELSGQASSDSCLHHAIVVGKGAKAEISLECSSSGAGKFLHTDVIECFIEDDASLSLASVQGYSDSDWSFTHIYGHLGRFSKFFHLAGAFGGAASRTRIENHMEGPHSSVRSLQAFFAQARQFSDLQASTYHHVPDTEGLMKAKGALTGSSRSAYKGYIKIDAGAKNTGTHQNGKALLLSHDAAANVMPALDVENNEVEAGHGAAVGELSEEELTYLRSRGLDVETARTLIVSGFFDETLSDFPYLAGRAKVKAHIEKRVNALKPNRG